MDRWLYYTRLTVLDLIRLWTTVQLHLIIVAGICLPILILLALKRGHVTELRKDLLRSPSGREVTFWSGQQGEILTPRAIERLEKEIAGVEIIIPEAQRIGNVAFTSEDGKRREVTSVTFFATRSGDPLMNQLGCDVLNRGELAAVLGGALGAQLQVKTGDTIQLTVQRERGGVRESATTNLGVKAFLPTSQENAKVAYLDRQLIEWLERYLQGYRVAELGWPAIKASAREEFSGYMLICEASNDLVPNDLRVLREQGYTVEAVKDAERAKLYGLLKSESLEKLRVYHIYALGSGTDRKQRLTRSPHEISDLTLADDVALPWGEPVETNLANSPYRLVGISLPRRTWLQSYLIHPDLAFGYEASEFSVKLLQDSQLSSAKSVTFQASQTLALRLAVVALSGSQFRPAEVAGIGASLTGLGAVAATMPAVSQGAQVAVAATWFAAMYGGATRASHAGRAPGVSSVALVPAPLLAHLEGLRDGTVEFDPANNMFVPVPTDAMFGRARLYAATIDHVPAVVEELRKRQFAFASQSGRIREIQTQDASLQLLVSIVGLGVFSFGVLTVFSVLVDSTDRKRAAIGILRVMGMSRVGVFYMVFLRAMIIGLLAGVATVALGYLGSWLFTWEPGTAWLRSFKPVIVTQIAVGDVVIIFAGAILCCLLGATWPAWRASRVDPLDAILEGRFR